jgi:hypothetical protein
LKNRQGRLSKVVVEKIEEKKARRKEEGRFRLCGWWVNANRIEAGLDKLCAIPSWVEPALITPD